MSALDIFKKIGGVAVNVALGSNPLLGAVVGAIAQEVVNQQSTATPNEVKKQSVAKVGNATAQSSGVHFDAHQMSVLIEGILAALKAAAEAGPKEK